MKTVSIKNFAGGMTADIRDEAKGVVKLVKHFDILTRPHSITPYHSQITGDSSASTNKSVDFLYYGSEVFARGVDGSNHAQVKLQSTFTSATWSTTANNVGSAVTAPQDGVFVEYHGFAYGMYNGGKIYKYDLNGAVAWVDDAVTGSVGGTTTSGRRPPNGIVHSKDDILYMAQNNVVASNNNGSWTNPALTLPSKYYITCLAEYGNYLAIACAPVNGGKSVVYLWDRDSTLNTLAEVIDFGLGNLVVIEQVEGQLIGITLKQDLFDNLSTKMVFRRYAGATAEVFRELLASSTTGLQLLSGQKFNPNRLYFLAGIEIDGVLHNGIWSLGKISASLTGETWSVWFDRLPNNDTAIAAGSLTGFFVLGDFAYISYNDSGYNLTMTSSGATAYAGSSLIETVINPDMPTEDKTSNKQLHVVAVSYDPLPTGAQVIFKYKVDGGAWTTVFTETTLNKVVTEMPLDATGTSFTAGREYQFRIESTGGAVITGLKYKYEILDTLI